MTVAAFTRLFSLVIFTLIICLPEVLMVHKGWGLKLFCAPCGASDNGSQAQTKHSGAVPFWREACGPALPSGGGARHPFCGGSDRSNGTYNGPNSADGAVCWYMCQTNTGMTDLHENISLSGPEVSLHMSVEMQLRWADSENLSFHGYFNQSCLHLHPPEKEEEDRGDGETRTFYCCSPDSPTPASTNNSHCSLSVTSLPASSKMHNKTHSLGWKQEDEWSGIFVALWLVLLCLLLLSVLTTVWEQVYKRRGHSRSSEKHTVGGHLIVEGFSDKEMQTVLDIPQVGQVDSTFGSPYCPALSTIHEEETPAHFHHRNHPALSPLNSELEA